MSKIGMRRGKRRAIHTLGIIKRFSEGKPYEIEISKIWNKNLLCRLISDYKIKEGVVYLVLLPWRPELEKEKFEKGIHSFMRLVEEELEGNQRHIYFQSLDSSFPIRSAEFWLDNRGRAKQISKEEIYYFSLIKEKRDFFDRYERGAIPSSLKAGRSEPDILSEKRIRNFVDMCADWRTNKVLDVAAGVKEYVKTLIERNFFIICANISASVLKTVSESFPQDNLAFVVYDADECLPFKKNSFNYVICDAILEYLSEPVSFIRDLFNVLSRGGEMLLLEPVRSNVKTEFYPQDMWELALWRPIYDSLFNFEIVQENLKKSGFEVIERKELKFNYPIFEEEFFEQSVSRCIKL